MRVARCRWLISLAAALGVAAAPAAAKQVGEVEVPDQARLGSSGPELRLNGAGIRTKLLVKVYVGGLYVSTPTRDADAVITDPGPQRVLIHAVRNLESKALADALRAGLDSNHTAGELAPLEGRIGELVTMLTARTTVSKGSEVFLDYLPDVGTQVVVDGAPLGTLPGADLHRALLKIWLGTKPVDAALKKAMLGL